MRWVQLGDAGTRFFHANATLRHRGKLINELTSREEVIVSDHKSKEDLLWAEFKDRMGSSSFTGFTIELGALIQADNNLQHLEDPFSHDEIDFVIMAFAKQQVPRARWIQ